MGAWWVTISASSPSLLSGGKELKFLLEDAAEILSFSSVTKSCPTPCDPMDCSTPGFPVHHYLPEFVQTQVL